MICTGKRFRGDSFNDFAGRIITNVPLIFPISQTVADANTAKISVQNPVFRLINKIGQMLLLAANNQIS